MDISQLLLYAAGVIFGISFCLTMGRMVAGPKFLDRLITFDGMVAITQCSLATYICITLDTTVASAMIVVALLGFIATIAITRSRKTNQEAKK